DIIDRLIAHSNGFMTRWRSKKPQLLPMSLILNSFRTSVIFASSLLFCGMFFF
ncbi:MAG: hypothetical protein ACI9J5_002512, partial [Paraglaciecola sp.]